MEAVRIVKGTAVALERSDVDTDQIISSDYLKRVERTGFGEGLFAEWRQDPKFVLNQPQYSGASILIAGPNFGTGSSREHAVWALMDYGFRAVVCARFADIFRNNCTKSGLLPVQVDEKIATAFMQAVNENPELEFVVDVANGTITANAAGIESSFPLDEFTRYRLLEGLDDIGLSMRHVSSIDDYESRRPKWLPKTA